MQVLPGGKENKKPLKTVRPDCRVIAYNLYKEEFDLSDLEQGKEDLQNCQ